MKGADPKLSWNNIHHMFYNFCNCRFENQFNEKDLVEKPVPAEFDHDGLLVSPALMPGIMDAETPAG